MSSVEHASRQWHFFTNHFHVLLVVARHPDARLRAVADEVGITKRAAHRILRDLSRAGYLTVTKRGRGNHYRLNEDTGLRQGPEQGGAARPAPPLGPADARSGG